jgi:hypothetical protein
MPDHQLSHLPVARLTSETFHATPFENKYNEFEDQSQELYNNELADYNRKTNKKS